MKRQSSPFGQWLRQVRMDRGWSLQKLADLAGVHRLQIQFVESGRTRLPRQATRIRLYAALGERPPMSVEIGVRRCAFCGAVAEARPLYRSHLKPDIGICAACVADVNGDIAIDIRRRTGRTRHEGAPRTGAERVT